MRYMIHTKLALIFAALLCVASSVGVCAAADLYLFDEARLLSPSEARTLEARLAEISSRSGVDVAIYADRALDGDDVVDKFDEIADSGVFGNDMVVLVIGLAGDRNMHIGTQGYGIRALTDAGIEYIFDRMVPSFKAGRWSEGMTVFADHVDSFVAQARTGRPFDVGNMPRGPLPIGGNIVLSLVIGFLIAIGVVASMKADLKSVHARQSAEDYTRAGSFAVTQRRDDFLYSTTTKRARPKKSSGGSSTRTSSSGATRGGGSRRF